MKKRFIFALTIFSLSAFLLINIFTLSFVNAQLNINPANPNDPLGIGINPETLPQNPDEIKNVSQTYLTQEWGKILEKYPVGRFVLGVSEILTALSPIFKLFIGVEYSLSWFFFISLFIWCSLIFIIYDPVRSIFQAKWWIALFISIIIPTLAAQFGTIKFVVDFFTPLLTNKWAVIFAIIILFLFLILYGLFMKYFGSIMKKKIEKENEDRRELKAKTVEKLNELNIKVTK